MGQAQEEEGAARWARRLWQALARHVQTYSHETSTADGAPRLTWSRGGTFFRRTIGNGPHTTDPPQAALTTNRDQGRHRRRRSARGGLRRVGRAHRGSRCRRRHGTRRCTTPRPPLCTTSSTGRSVAGVVCSSTEAAMSWSTSPIAVWRAVSPQKNKCT